jgi:hypothetical protein
LRAVTLSAQKDVEEAVAEHHDLLEIVFTVLGVSPPSAKDLLDRRDVGTLKEIGGGGGYEVEDLLRMRVQGADPEQHPGRHVDVADREALGDRLLCCAKRLVE